MENQQSCAVIGQCCVGVGSMRNVIDSCSMIWAAVTRKLCQAQSHRGSNPVVKIIAGCFNDHHNWIMVDLVEIPWWENTVFLLHLDLVCGL